MVRAFLVVYGKKIERSISLSLFLIHLIDLPTFIEDQLIESNSDEHGMLSFPDWVSLQDVVNGNKSFGEYTSVFQSAADGGLLDNP